LGNQDPILTVHWLFLRCIFHLHGPKFIIKKV